MSIAALAPTRTSRARSRNRRPPLRLFLLALLAVLSPRCQEPGAAMSDSTELRLVLTVPLPEVKGRIDHLAYDPATSRLFVAALGNDTVEVIDVREGKLLSSIGGFDEPQGIVFAPATGRLHVACGGSGRLETLDAKTFQKVASLDLGGDADNVRLDPADGSLVVGCRSGALAFVDAKGDRIDRVVALAAHPESFQLEGRGSRVFVNVPGAKEIAVVDRRGSESPRKWSCGDSLANFPMALDEARSRLLVGFRNPARLAAYDLATGERRSVLEVVGDADDIFVNDGRILVIGGEGFIDLVGTDARGKLERQGRVATRDGARTGLWVETLNRLFVALPRRDGKAAEIRAYERLP